MRRIVSANGDMIFVLNTCGLSAVIEELGHPRVLALTATASPPVREEITGTIEHARLASHCEGL